MRLSKDKKSLIRQITEGCGWNSVQFRPTNLGYCRVSISAKEPKKYGDLEDTIRALEAVGFPLRVTAVSSDSTTVRGQLRDCTNDYDALGTIKQPEPKVCEVEVGNVTREELERALKAIIEKFSQQEDFNSDPSLCNCYGCVQERGYRVNNSISPGVNVVENDTCGCYTDTSYADGYEVSIPVKCDQHKPVLQITIGETITVADLAAKMAVKGADVVKALFKKGVMVTINQLIDFETAHYIAADEFGVEVLQEQDQQHYPDVVKDVREECECPLCQAGVPLVEEKAPQPEVLAKLEGWQKRLVDEHDRLHDRTKNAFFFTTTETFENMTDDEKYFFGRQLKCMAELGYAMAERIEHYGLGHYSNARAILPNVSIP